MNKRYYIKNMIIKILNIFRNKIKKILNRKILEYKMK